MKDFNSSLEVGKKAEKEFEAILKRCKGIKCCGLVDWQKYGFDIGAVKKDGSKFGVEVKSLEGEIKDRCLLSTAVVEVWADDKMTRRPHWWGKTDYIVFQNRATNTWYIYNAKKLIKTLETVSDGHITRARDNNKDDWGWIVKFYWEPVESPAPSCYNLDGFIKKLK
jgi:hypothetical protein